MQILFVVNKIFSNCLEKSNQNIFVILQTNNLPDLET